MLERAEDSWASEGKCVAYLARGIHAVYFHRQMSSTTSQAQINCPNCGTPIDVNKVLFKKVRIEIGGVNGRMRELHRNRGHIRALVPLLS